MMMTANEVPRAWAWRRNSQGTAMAARTTVATVHQVVDLGALDPECVVTPGLFVQRVVRVERVATSGGGFKNAA